MLQVTSAASAAAKSLQWLLVCVAHRNAAHVAALARVGLGHLLASNVEVVCQQLFFFPVACAGKEGMVMERA